MKHKLQPYQRQLLEWLENKTPEQIKEAIYQAFNNVRLRSRKFKPIPPGVYRGTFKIVGREEQCGRKAVVFIIDDLAGAANEIIQDPKKEG